MKIQWGRRIGRRWTKMNLLVKARNERRIKESTDMKMHGGE